MADNMLKLSISNTEDADMREVTASLRLETNRELIEKADLGKTRQKCRLCGAEGNFQTWRGIENYLGIRDEFDYFICPECETMQITEIPENIKKYYPSNYYSFYPPAIEPVRFGAVRDNRTILDVGAGSGAWLCYLATLGCVNLFGCDPYIHNDLTYSNGVTVKKCTIHEMEGTYDVIHMGDTFEHLADPHEVFKTLDRLLKKEGEYGEAPKIEISMPVFPNSVFDIYGPYWFQMDPPRHIIIHSKKSIQMLADRYGFRIENISYDNTGSPYIISRLYQFEVPFGQWNQRYQFDSLFAGLRKQDAHISALGQIASLTGQSDHAVFTLVRK
ncbi:MAG: class I SAM-dependent methyltransferase [Clostridiales bacterium]|jgi:SAM-dependent methyltransferase|nr:class I SAM-dependent methyltransferase [Clostridiales bacterium]